MANTKVTGELIADNAIKAVHIDETATGITLADLTVSGPFASQPNIIVDTANNRVGIGTNNTPDKLSVGGFGNTFISLSSLTSSPALLGIRFSQSTNTAIEGAEVSYDVGNQLFQIKTGQSSFTPRLTIERDTGDVTIQGSRIYLKESDLENTALALTRDADEGYLQLFSSGVQTVELRGNGNSYINGGNVGVGLNPSGYNGTAGTRVLAVGGTTGNNGVNVVSGTTSTGSYMFSDSGGNDRGGFTYYHTADLMTVTTNGSEAMRIHSSGSVGINTSVEKSIFQVAGIAPTYTNGVTVFYGTTTNNLYHSGLTLNSWGNALQGSIGSNLTFNNPTLVQTNTDRSSGHLKFANTTTTGLTSAFIFTGVLKGTSSEIERARINYDGSVWIGNHGGDLNLNNGFVFEQNGFMKATRNFSTTGEIIVLNQRDGQGTTQVDFRNGNVERGRIEWTTSGTTYNTTSDYRIKENVYELTGCLEKVNLLKPKTFNYIDGNGSIVSGFIAHEVQEVVPEAVSGNKDDVREDGTPKYQGMDHSRLVPILVGAIKEQQEIINDLKTRIETLEAK